MTTGTATTGRIRRAARRGLAALALVWVDPGGSVTFTNRIAPETVQVGGGGLLPSLVTVQVFTDVTLGLPSGSTPLARDASVTERFDSTCPTCTITYTYRVVVPDTSIAGSVLTAVTTRALSTLPQNQLVTYGGRQTTVQIGVPTPFLVDTLVPLPDLPSVDVPSLPPVDVPLPSLPSLPAPVPTPPATPLPTVPDQAPAAPQVSGVDGTGYAYDLGGGAAEMAPSGGGAAAFDPSALLPGSAAGTGDGAAAGSGSGGIAGGRDGVAVPVSGALEDLDGTGLDEESSTVTADGAATGPGLPLPALLAVVALAGATATLVRTHLAIRAR